MFIAVIPARGGSKRISKKNIKKFAGTPAISRAIKAAKKTKLFDRIIVSTDDHKIASISKKYNAEIPFIRPSKLADDKTIVSKVVAHAIKWLHSKKQYPKEVCCIFPTAVFVKDKDIIKAYKIFKTGKWNFVFSATTFAHTFERSFYKKKNNSVKMLFPKRYKKRTQDFKTMYYDAGQFYWGKTEAWLKNKPVFDKSSTIINIPTWRAHDIDTLDDWKRAEIYSKYIK